MPGSRTDASPMLGRTGTPTFRTRRSGRCSRRSVQAWCLMSARSTAFTRCRRRCPKPASCALTVTDTWSRPARSGGPSRSGPMPIAWNAGRMVRSWPAMIGSSAAARRSTIRFITSRFWRASPAPCATGRRSRTGVCHRPCAVCSASSNDSPVATDRWSRSSAPCSSTGWTPSKPLVRRPCHMASIPLASF